MPRSRKPDWSRPLAKPIDIGSRRKLRTLHDVRAYLLKLPDDRARNASWQVMAANITRAAETGETLDLTFPFRFARALRH